MVDDTKAGSDAVDAGRVAGLVVGALSGARVGSAVVPVLGTFVGAVAGGLVGSGAGCLLSRALVKGAAATARGMSTLATETSSALAS